MRYFKMVAFVLLPVVMLALAGCGSSSSGSASTDPFSSSSAGTGTGTGTGTTPVTVQDPAFSLTLGTDLTKPTDLTVLPQVDANIGTVLLTAKLLNVSGDVFIDTVSNQPIAPGAPVPNQAVTFTILAGPGAISYTTPLTDKNGEAKAVLTTGNVLFTTNVIVEAATTVGGKNYRAYTSFQIVRGTGVIMFTSAAGASPGSQTNMLVPGTKEVDPNISPAWSFMQLIPFKVTDSNGNPRVGVPVTLSVYSLTTLNPNDVTIDFLLPPITEPNQQTITTDSAGQGIFNVTVTVATPPPGGVNISDVVFKAVTNDVAPVTAYVGNSYTLSSKVPTLAIAPTSASFTAADVAGATRTFTVSGGKAPYSASSSNSARVTASVSGTIITVTLIDASAWTEVVKISALDSSGQTASASLSRQ